MGTQEATAAPRPGERWLHRGLAHDGVQGTSCPALPSSPRPWAEACMRVYTGIYTQRGCAHGCRETHCLCARSAYVHVGVYVHHTTVRK